MDQKSAHSNGSGGADQAGAYRLIDHTADLGFTVEAPDLPALFARAGLALHDIMADSRAAAPIVERRLDVEGADLEDLLVRFLEEAHYAFEGERILFREVEVSRVDPPEEGGGRPGRVEGVGRGEPFDPARHELRRPVKAVTYHAIEVSRAGASYRASVILDL